MTPPIQLRSDLNAEDDDGENWALLANACDQSEIRVGAVVVAGTPGFWSVVRITAVDADGQAHFVQLDDNDPLPTSCSPLLPDRPGRTAG